MKRWSTRGRRLKISAHQDARYPEFHEKLVGREAPTRETQYKGERHWNSCPNDRGLRSVAYQFDGNRSSLSGQHGRTNTGHDGNITD